LKNDQPRASRAVLFATLAGALSLVPGLTVGLEPTVPRAQGFVSDYAGVVDAATRRDLDGLIAELKAKTGAEIAVVVVNSTQPLTVFDYAMKIAESWKPGARGKDNGVVFLVAIKDRGSSCRRSGAATMRAASARAPRPSPGSLQRTLACGLMPYSRRRVQPGRSRPCSPPCFRFC
jgi:hypothetical protein